VDILKEDRDNWSEVQQNMGKALDEMRINWDSQLKIKELNSASNPLLNRRIKKSKTNEKLSESSKSSTTSTTNASANSLSPSNQVSLKAESDSKKISSLNTIVDQDIKVQSLSREPSDISMRSLTPSNSRQASPQRK